MKIIADENLAFTEYFFSEFGNVEHRGGRLLQHEDVQDADVLVIRSVTKVDHALIDHSALKFVGSATIGTDHMDLAALQQQGIAWSNAPGCNAQAVAEYVITALLHLRPKLLQQEQKFILGIIGLGNVGRRLVHMAKLLDWQVIGYDPYVQLDQIENVPLDELLQRSHAISIHVPLTKSDDHPTYHLINADRLARIPAQTILVNSARGPVIEEVALIEDIQKTHRQVVLDVFEHEPMISEQLLDLVSLVTPHIAGYSLEGKARGTQMVYQAFCQHFGFQAKKQFESQLPVGKAYFQDLSLKQALQQHLGEIYDIQRDDQHLRACIKNGKVDQQAFDRLRKEYPLRREWAAHGGPVA